MSHRRLWALGSALAIAVGAPAGAQMWFDTAGIMVPVVLNPCPDGRCPAVANAESAPGRKPAKDAQGERSQAPARAAPSDGLTYTPSMQRRRNNLAAIVGKTRQQNPESAAAMEQLFARTDIFARISEVLAPHDYSVENLGDAYAFWWMTAWEGAQGSNRTPSPGEMRAVQAQAHSALAAASEIARASDTRKQEMAEALWFQASLIDSMIDSAKQNPQLMLRVKQAIRQGASATGVDLNTMRLTQAGFVHR